MTPPFLNNLPSISRLRRLLMRDEDFFIICRTFAPTAGLGGQSPGLSRHSPDFCSQAPEFSASPPNSVNCLTCHSSLHQHRVCRLPQCPPPAPFGICPGRRAPSLVNVASRRRGPALSPIILPLALNLLSVMHDSGKIFCRCTS